MTDLERARRAAERAAREAGRLLLEHLGRLAPGDVGTKSAARDLVTTADLASERRVLELLSEEFPDHAFEAEEGTRAAPRAPGQPTWIVDPLDGTVNFVHRLPCFAVSIALCVDDEPLVGVVHAPRLGETFSAARGAGATLAADGGRTAPLRVSGTKALGEALLATGFPYRRRELAHDNLANFGRFFHDVRDLRRMGSAALDLAYTAAGRFDGFWELHLSPHDVAAGALLVREAGGVVSDADGGERWLRGGSIVAAGAGLHGAIRARLDH